MVLKTKDFQDSCKQILMAVDGGSTEFEANKLELVAKNRELKLNVTNNEYLVTITSKLDTDVDDFRIVVDAVIFLNLISKITTDTIELSVSGNNLIVKGNGTYKIAMTTDSKGVITIEKITIDNVLKHFNISGDALRSIVNNNSLDVAKANNVSSPIQKLYYVDEHGCLTFTTGACVNAFELEQPVKMLLQDKVVKLFKLIKGEVVDFTFGIDDNHGTSQTKAKFACDGVEITAILDSDKNNMEKFPTSAIRARANDTYPYSISVDKQDVINACSRLMLLNPTDVNKDFGYLTFENKTLKIEDTRKENVEIIPLQNEIANEYSAILNMSDLSKLLSNCTEQYVNLSFGNHEAMILSRGNIKNVIPEVPKN